MYTPVHENTITYSEKLKHWKNHIVADRTQCIEYLEIGSVLEFHNMSGDNVHSTCIDLYSPCDNYLEFQNKHETNAFA